LVLKVNNKLVKRSAYVDSPYSLRISPYILRSFTCAERELNAL